MSVDEKAKQVASEVGTFANGLPDHIEDARLVAESWKQRAQEFVRKNPGAALAGAFAIGFILAKVARHA
ncbi:MAG: hypothetical protein KA712_13630 [Myxococcales bacterium]|nr:hypothetical protein [Myxococcales bacterium]